MTEIIKETVTTQGSTSTPVTKSTVKVKASPTQSIEYLLYFIFGVLEILLAFRFVLKLTGANVASAFVSFVYGLSGIFVAPFEGIFRKGYAPGVETTAVLEPSVLVALAVYPVISWGILTLIRIFSGEQPEA
jgi:hypothetical protein